MGNQLFKLYLINCKMLLHFKRVNMKYCLNFLYENVKASILILLWIQIMSCKSNTNNIDINELKEKIVKTEKDFETAVKERGVQQAFYELQND